MVSPDAKRAVFAKHNNLWLRSLEDGVEQQLTFDGEKDFAYGVAPGNLPGKLNMIRTGIDGPLFWVTWSPDSKRVLVPRLDERKVRRYNFTQDLPAMAATHRKPFQNQLRWSETRRISSGTGLSWTWTAGQCSRWR